MHKIINNDIFSFEFASASFYYMFIYKLIISSAALFRFSIEQISMGRCMLFERI